MDETQEVADARESRDLVIAAALPLAMRAIAHVEEHDVKYVGIEEELPAGGFVWELMAIYSRGRAFVRVTADAVPAPDTPQMVTPETMARLMGNSSAGFDVQVPRAWVEHAAAAAAAGPLGP